MNIPGDLSYTREHEWIRIKGDTATIGITDHAQEQLGDITYVELPELDAKVSQGGELATIESVKAASDVYAPVTGTVASVNDALDDAPETINTDPYGAGWICSLTGISEDEVSSLMTAQQYGAFLAEEK
jgi:glycine cleavage system H protein